MSADLLEARATIVEVLAHGAYRAELRNGHRAIVRPEKNQAATYAPGDFVLLALHPANLSRGRIIAGA